MKNTILPALTGVVMIGLIGCMDTQRKQLNVLIGADESKIVSKWGTPDTIHPMSDGGKILVYTNEPTKRYHNDPNTSLGGGFYWPGATTITLIPHSTQFTVNSNGVVTGWAKR